MLILDPFYNCQFKVLTVSLIGRFVRKGDSLFSSASLLACVTKRVNLCQDKIGIMRWMAYAWSRTRIGGWAVAQSPILGTTITVARLRRKGYVSMVDYYSKFKTPI